MSFTYTEAYDPNEFQETIYLTYDVDRPTLAGGDLLVRDGHFVHFIRKSLKSFEDIFCIIMQKILKQDYFLLKFFYSLLGLQNTFYNFDI